jgi:hypothetical protein
MTTKSQTFQIIAVVTLSAASAGAGSQIQRALDTGDFERSLKLINERCNNDPSKVPGAALPPPLGTADLRGDE